MKLQSMVLASALMVALVASMASADMMSFSYNNFDSKFVLGTNTYSIDYDTTGLDYTAGAGTRHVLTAATTVTDWSAAFGKSDVNVDLTISDVTTTSAHGVGTLTWVDMDGDKVTADIVGDWDKVGGSAVFGGVLSNVAIDTTTEGNGVFNGTDGNSFSLDFSAFGFPPAIMTGALVELKSSGVWFTNGFSGVSTNVSATFVPVPGAVLLGAMGLGLVGWVKRRFA